VAGLEEESMSRRQVSRQIETLLEETVGTISARTLAEIVRRRRQNLEHGFELLEEYDSTIPGKGIHNINRLGEHGVWHGNYEIQDRSVYRPIQYIESYFLREEFEWLTRDTVQKACLHLETILKRFCRNRDYSRLPLGRLLETKEAKTLPQPLRIHLRLVNELLYNPAKHEIPRADRHLFTEAEAIAAYFICRKLGHQLLSIAVENARS
jgi:hypothetical protein